MSETYLPDTTETTDKITTLVANAREFVIATDDDYARAVDFVKGVKELRQQIADTFDPHVRRAFDAHRALCADRKRADDAAAEAERIVKDAIVAWDAERERLRAIEIARLDAVVAEAALDAAVDAEAAGDHALADAILTSAPTAALPSRPRVDGVRFTERWSARVDDFGKLVAHVAAHPELLGLLKPDQRALDGQAKSLRGRLALPGVTATSARDVAVGR